MTAPWFTRAFMSGNFKNKKIEKWQTKFNFALLFQCKEEDAEEEEQNHASSHPRQRVEQEFTQLLYETGQQGGGGPAQGAHLKHEGENQAN